MKTYTVLHELKDKVSKFDVFLKNAIVGILTDDAFARWVTKLNTDRLEQEGTYIDGSKIITFKAEPPNRYASFTVTVKKSKGQITSHVTLKDSGDFHNSFFLEIKGYTAYIEAKIPNGLEQNVDIDRVFGWTDRQYNLIVKAIKQKLNERIINYLLN